MRPGFSNEIQNIIHTNRYHPYMHVCIIKILLQIIVMASKEKCCRAAHLPVAAALSCFVLSYYYKTYQQKLHTEHLE